MNTLALPPQQQQQALHSSSAMVTAAGGTAQAGDGLGLSPRRKRSASSSGPLSSVFSMDVDDKVRQAAQRRLNPEVVHMRKRRWKLMRTLLECDEEELASHLNKVRKVVAKRARDQIGSGALGFAPYAEQNVGVPLDDKFLRSDPSFVIKSKSTRQVVVNSNELLPGMGGAAGSKQSSGKMKRAIRRHRRRNRKDNAKPAMGAAQTTLYGLPPTLLGAAKQVRARARSHSRSPHDRSAAESAGRSDTSSSGRRRMRRKKSLLVDGGAEADALPGSMKRRRSRRKKSIADVAGSRASKSAGAVAATRRQHKKKKKQPEIVLSDQPQPSLSRVLSSSPSSSRSPSPPPLPSTGSDSGDVEVELSQDDDSDIDLLSDLSDVDDSDDDDEKEEEEDLSDLSDVDDSLSDLSDDDDDDIEVIYECDDDDLDMDVDDEDEDDDERVAKLMRSGVFGSFDTLPSDADAGGHLELACVPEHIDLRGVPRGACRGGPSCDGCESFVRNPKGYPHACHRCGCPPAKHARHADGAQRQQQERATSFADRHLDLRAAYVLADPVRMSAESSAYAQYASSATKSVYDQLAAVANGQPDDDNESDKKKKKKRKKKKSNQSKTRRKKKKNKEGDQGMRDDDSGGGDSSDDDLDDDNDWDWNERFQSVIAKLLNVSSMMTLDEKIEANVDLLQLSQDFVHAVKRYGKIIVSERYLTNKTIEPDTRFKGHAGGSKYLVQGMLSIKQASKQVCDGTNVFLLWQAFFSNSYVFFSTC
jgi:Clustered mitochondria